MAIDFMGVLRRCAKCRSADDSVAWSNVFNCYICDDCYTGDCDAMLDEKEEYDQS